MGTNSTNLAVSNHEAEAVSLIAATSLAGKLCQGRMIRKIIFLVNNIAKGSSKGLKTQLLRNRVDHFFQVIDKNLAALPPWAEVVIVWCPGHKDITGNEMGRLA
ncbi:uncharacterized protein PGTG_10630 [Puccinia graminis f. sp. tritici CRL 75-36-700-3]|uniref:RNase H type-1 domain-containing protein n=1 Tax=Puccinia graminis f. sp. tritici (strain CRL 75-36-700-3 / race SCCL) TaxID=418459 RepID=E3KIX7_PUCGT|nr:uncharacterized protein PGTG_10630 [Puccinia graminis f. sp. tritici CRL 75-36-700-3]EFP84252.1 hypothetical protein PGTG_10630 [Puccinia graminis f. sp. tritici CRL 75-36-700-3]